MNGTVVFVDARVLLLDLDLDGGQHGWDRFEHEVIEAAGRLQSYRFPEDDSQVFAVLGDLYDRLSMLHDAVGDASVYLYSADSEVALRVLSDFANGAKGFIRVGSTDADQIATTIALTVVSDLRAMPAHVGVVGREQDMDAVRARLAVYLDGDITFSVVGCGRLGVLEAEAREASHPAPRDA